MDTLRGLEEWSAVNIVALVSAFTVVIHLALPIAFTASCAFLLPLDAVPLVTYTKGYYRMLDILCKEPLVGAVGPRCGQRST